ncbi:arogenate dehydrogenase 1, chloroplastic-like [Wolffia australiana]
MAEQRGRLKIGIVGFGSFAQFLAAAMRRQGHSLFATSRSDYSLQCSQMGIIFLRDAAELLEMEIEVVLICTSIVSLEQVLRSLPVHGCRRGPRLFVDVLSVKQHPRDLLLQSLPEEGDVLCTHPMFGPESGKHGWAGLPLVFERVRIREQGLCAEFLDIFRLEGCRMVEMPCEEHDRIAARSQFLTHTVGRVLSEMELEATPIDTKGFQALLQLRDNTTRDSLDLYLGLFRHNKFAMEELEKLEAAFQSVKKKLLEGVGNDAQARL